MHQNVHETNSVTTPNRRSASCPIARPMLVTNAHERALTWEEQYNGVDDKLIIPDKLKLK